MSPCKPLAATLLALLCLCACQDEGRRSIATPGDVAQAQAAATAAPQTIEEQLARRFAPHYRFNAYFADGDPSLSNRSEDFFPGDVRAFFDALVAGQALVVTRMAHLDTPGEIHLVPFSTQPVLRPDRIEGYPKAMAGEVPGQAPLYVHPYEDSAARRTLPGGLEERSYFIEYWQWYPYDYACSRVLGRFGCFGEHRADWEHISLQTLATIDAAGRVASARIVLAYYFEHGHSLAVGPQELETVDDAEGPGGEHPVVYVAAGKHASYPQAGERHDFATRSAFSDHDDFFRGNGAWVAGWRSTLVDISRAAQQRDPSIHSSPAFERIVAVSPIAPRPMPSSWWHFMGRWGPDLDGISTGVGSFYWAESAIGPWAKPDFGDRGAGALPYAQWRAKQGAKLEIYALQARSVPRAQPIPLPVIR